MLRSATVTALTLASLLFASSAPAAFPGENGRISFTSNRDGNGEIYSARSDGGDPRRLTTDAADDAQSAWSPDGSRIAFRRNLGTPSTSNYEVYVMDADGSDATRLTFAEGSYESQPAWSPDGRRLLFRSNRDGGPDGDIWVMGADGSNPAPLTANGDDERYPGFSPDGSRIVFRRTVAANVDIFTMAAGGGDEQRLTSAPAHDSAPAWSPEGSRIAFESDRDGSLDVYVMNADGGGVVRLTDSPALDEGPAFSPDGRRLVFTSERDAGNSEIYTMAGDGSGEAPLAPAAAKEESPDWQPLPAVEEPAPEPKPTPSPVASGSDGAGGPAAPATATSPPSLPVGAETSAALSRALEDLAKRLGRMTPAQLRGRSRLTVRVRGLSRPGRLRLRVSAAGRTLAVTSTSATRIVLARPRRSTRRRLLLSLSHTPPAGQRTTVQRRASLRRG